MYAIAQHAALASASAGHFSLALVSALPIVAYLVFVLWALASIIASPQDFGMKVVWVVLVLVAPFIGSLLWFFIGRGHARRNAHGPHVHVHQGH